MGNSVSHKKIALTHFDFDHIWYRIKLLKVYLS